MRPGPGGAAQLTLAEPGLDSAEAMRRLLDSGPRHHCSANALELTITAKEGSLADLSSKAEAAGASWVIEEVSF